MSRIRQFGTALLFGLGMTFAVQTSALAENANEFLPTVRQYQARMDKIKSMDHSRYMTEMSTVTEWLEQSIILIDRNDPKQVRTLVVKTGVYLDYIETNLAKDAAMGKATKAETELKALKAEYGKVEAEVQQLEAEEAKLTKQLEELTKK